MRRPASSADHPTVGADENPREDHERRSDDMPFLVFDEIEKETVTPKYSTAYGELVTGEFIEVGRLSFKAGEGAVEHAHPHEQVMYVISGRLSVDLEGEHAELGPGMGFHAKPNQKHRVQAVEDTQVISSKHVIEGVGHKI
jgi:quercetin dioxygenase-like cupin family protein